MSKISSSGNFDKGVRSDCKVTLELTENGGKQIILESKVKKLYGNSIKKLAEDVLTFYKIENAKLHIQDSGALDFVLAARIEAAIKMLIDTDKDFLLPQLKQNTNETARDVFRHTRLYLPGNSPKLMINAGIHNPNGIILDLEDSVAPPKKFEAKILVRNALRNIDFYGAERMVRINQFPRGLEDLEQIIPQKPNLILLPKCESAQQVKDLVAKIKEIQNGEKHNVWIMPIIESALGVEKSFEIATVSEYVVAISLGLEDLTADLGVQRTPEDDETLYARTRVVNACKAAGIQPIDSVFSDVSDMEGLYNKVLKSKSLGFEGMGCIHPRQIKVINKAFLPSKEEVEKAQKIVDAFYEAKEKGLGVVSLGSKMIDPPVVKRALQTLKKIGK